METHTTTDLAGVLIARTALKGIDLALDESLQKAVPPTTSSTLQDHVEQTPLDAVVVSPRVAEELAPEDIMQAVKQVLSFTFPTTTSGPDDLSVFSGYIFVGGKQLTWTRHIVDRMGGSKITMSLREEKDTLLANCLDARTAFALQ